MATVRITNGLRTHIIIAAKSIHAPKIQNAQYGVKFPYTGDEFYAMLMDPWQAQIEALPSQFFNMVTKIRIRSVGGVTTADWAVNMSPRRFPKKFPDGHDVEVAYYVSNDPTVIVVLKTHAGRWVPLAEKAKELKENYDRALIEADTFVTGVETILDSHSTLNAAVKAWPALWELVPEPAKDAMRSKANAAARAANSKPAVKVDTDRMTAIMAASKIL